MKALCMKTMHLYLIFQFFKGCCHGNQIMLWKCYQRRLIPLAFVALLLENELQYYDLAVHINSGDDRATSSKNLVNFCVVTLEMTRLICEHQVRHVQKLAYFVEYLRIHWKYFRNIFCPVELRSVKILDALSSVIVVRSGVPQGYFWTHSVFVVCEWHCRYFFLVFQCLVSFVLMTSSSILVTVWIWLIRILVLS